MSKKVEYKLIYKYIKTHIQKCYVDLNANKFFIWLIWALGKFSTCNFENDDTLHHLKRYYEFKQVYVQIRV